MAKLAGALPQLVVVVVVVVVAAVVDIVEHTKL
jgi:hypothetical protein